MSLDKAEREEIQAVFRSLAGMVEGLTLRLEQIERLLSLRLKTKVMAVGKDDGRDAAELLNGIREGVQIETIILDVGTRLADLERAVFAPPEHGGLFKDAGAGEAAGGLSLVPSGDSEPAGEDPEGSTDAVGDPGLPE